MSKNNYRNGNEVLEEYRNLHQILDNIAKKCSIELFNAEIDLFRCLIRNVLDTY